MDAPTVSAIAGSVSAFFAAISALVNSYNTSTFRRQLKNTSIDACVAAGLGLKSLVHRTIELKGRNTDGEDIKDSEIFAVYEEAWTKWVLFAQAYQIARRYSSKLDPDAPSKAALRLSELRIVLRNPDWKQEAEKIRVAVDEIVKQTAATLGTSLV